jgi:FAD/FMN-containing dehydrogenase
MERAVFMNPLAPEAAGADPALLRSFAADESGVAGQAPSQVLYPRSREDVQGIVREAIRTATPLVPVSSGPPHFHGDTVPVRGGIVVDFSRMNRVLRIDPVSRSVRIEPGVTYGELIPQLRAQGLRLSLPLLPRANKSVVASRLEREPSTIPKYQYDYMDPLLTLEVVYGTGEDFRTGSACGPGTLDTLKADLVNPWGPGSIDYFRLVSAAQGTMGLVTWAVMKAEVLPQLQQLRVLQAEEPARLLRPIDELLRRRVLDECVVLNRAALATLLAGEGMRDYAALAGALPAWSALLVIAGYERRPAERVALYDKALHDIAASCGVETRADLPGAPGREAELLELLSGTWTKSPDWRLRATGASRELLFIAPLSRVPRLLGTLRELAAQRRIPMQDVPCHIQPMVQGRGCHCELVFPRAPADAAAAAGLDAFLREAAAQLRRAGAFFSRPYGEWAQLAYADYAGGVDALRRLKGVFDPHGLFNPGKLCF